MPYIDVASSYTVISSIDMEKAELLSSKSLLGVGGTVYMNSKNLYIATARYEYEQSDEYQQEQYTVVEHKNSNFTDIVRIELSADINVSANGSVSGQLLNQFSMDEYNDYLRVVTTVDNSSYKIFSDDKHGLAKYEWDEEVLSNSLYVLDDQLQIVGAIEEMGEDERVYSVRFDGDIGYFVTFRQTDPLFAVELSDPSNPKVLSALKISGFSEYLHVYGDNKLFGLGMEADEETGITQCMKLSMFDISDPADVTECAKILIEDCYWSEALYNHKTILISEEKNMIAFPVEGRYVVYGYSDEMGFYIRASFDVDEMDIYNVRGLYIGDYIYICSTELIEVFDMSEFINIAQIAF